MGSPAYFFLEATGFFAGFLAAAGFLAIVFLTAGFFAAAGFFAGAGFLAAAGFLAHGRRLLFGGLRVITCLAISSTSPAPNPVSRALQPLYRSARGGGWRRTDHRI